MIQTEGASQNIIQVKWQSTAQFTTIPNSNGKLVNYHTPENRKIRNMNDENITNIPKLFKEQKN